MTAVLEALNALDIEVLGESTNASTDALEYKARCPWHYDGTKFDHNPGWYINAETGAHICFSCGYRGTLQVLAYRLLDLDWDAAGKWAEDRSDVFARFASRDPWTREERERKPLAPINDARILAFDDVPDTQLAQRQIERESADAYEVRWDSKSSAWILPIREPQGALLGWQVKGTGEDRLFRNFPLGVQKGATLFGMKTLTGNEDVVVVESPLDAVRLHTLGFASVATFGATVTPAQMELLIEHCGSLTVAMDNPYKDAAGKRSSLWMLGLDQDGKRLRRGQDYSKRITIRFLDYQGFEGKDAGELTAAEIRRGYLKSRGSVWGPKAVCF